MPDLYSAAAGVVLFVFCQPLVGSQDERWKQLSEQSTSLQYGGRYDEAEHVALDLARELDSSSVKTVWLAAALHNAGRVQLFLGKHPEAEQSLQRAIRILEGLGRTEGQDIVLALTDLSTLYDGCGQFGRANRLQKRAMDICERNELTQAPECLRVVHDHAISLSLQRKYDQAEAAFRWLLGRLDGSSPEHAAIKYMAHRHLAILLLRSNLVDDAVRQGRLSVESAEALFGTDHPLTVDPHLTLAGIELGLGRVEEAENRYRRALRIAESTLGPSSPLYGIALWEYAASLRKMKRKDEAGKLERMAKSIIDRSQWLQVQRGVVDISDLR